MADVVARPADLTRLATVPLFSGLPPAQLARIAARSVVRVVDPDTVVASRGQPADHLIVVESGTLVAVRHTPGGRLLRLGDFPGPCAVDKTAVLDSGGYTATWTAAARSRLRLLPADEFLALLDDVPATRRHVLRRLSEQVRHQQDTLVDACFSDTATRIARWLVAAVGRAGRCRVVLPGAQQGLADTLGVTRVSVNRALGSLTRAGLIRTEPGVVTVLAPELLSRRAHGGEPSTSKRFA